MHFEGTFEVPLPREKVYRSLTSPAFLIGALPDVEQSSVDGPDSFTVKAKVGVAYIRGGVTLKFQITEKQPASFAKVSGKGSGIQSTINLTMGVTLREQGPERTNAMWSADATIGGLLASVGNRLLNTVAEKYVKQITDSIQTQLSAQ